MKKIMLPLFVSLLSTTLFSAEPEPLKVDPSAQAKADQQMKLQNKNVIKHVLDEYSKKVPQKVDEYTTFTNISSDDLKLIYTYEINTGAKSDETVIKEDGPRMSKYIKNGICMSSKRFLESDIEIEYIYNSAKTKKELFAFHVVAKDCEQLW